MRKFISFLSFFLLLNQFNFSQSTNKYLVSVNLNHSRLEQLSQLINPVVFYQTENELLITLNQSEIELLESNNIELKVISEFNADDKYFLITNKINREEPLNLTPVYDFGKMLLVKNLSEHELRSAKFHATQLKAVQKISQTTNQIPAKTFGISDELDDLISSVIEDINPDSVEYFIQSLQDFGTRFLLAPNRKDIALWIKNEFERFGIQNVAIDSFYIYNTWQYNVIATIPSDIETNEVMVVGGHHDSITRTTPENYAPGADDNASGTAAVLETARVIMQNEITKRASVKFVTFAAEEYGLHGSENFAGKAGDSGMKIKLMINHDMISYTPNPVELSKVTINYYTGSEYFTQLANNCIDKYSLLSPGTNGTSNASFSDSYSFWTEGFPAVYFEESSFSPYYHTDNDKIENYNMEYCSEVIKASCATLISAMMIPSPIENLTVSDNNGTSVFLRWNEINASDVVGYRVYIGTESREYDRIIETMDYELLIDGLTENTEYFFGVAAVNDAGFESIIVEKNFIPMVFHLDQGVLLVDETRDGDGSRTNPTDQEVDEFYTSIINAQYLSKKDVTASSDISISDFTKYSTIIWHGNDLYSVTAPSGLKEEFKRYLDAGGNLLFTVFLPSKAFMGVSANSIEFEPGSFMFDYLKISNTEKQPGSRYFGSISTTAEYPDLFVDTTKTLESKEYHISNIEAVYPTEDAKEIYTFDTRFDESTIQGSMKGKPVGIEYMGEKNKLIVLTFPLYYCEYETAKQFLEKVLTEKFDEPTGILVDAAQTPSQFSLSQNYPNPFNPTTTIKYSIPNVGGAFNASRLNVTLKIYDILGREIATLVNETKTPGTYEIGFDATNLSSGVYFYQLSYSGNTKTKKMLLLK